MVFPQDEVVAICAVAREHGVAKYLDGARLFNTAVASGRAGRTRRAVRYGVGFVQQGPWRPAGSVLAGPRDSITRAVLADAWGVRCDRWAFSPRRRCTVSTTSSRGSSTTMRTRGYKHRELRRGATRPRERADEHRRLPVLKPRRMLRRSWRAQERRAVCAFAPRTVRAVTHLNVDAAQCYRAADVLASAIMP